MERQRDGEDLRELARLTEKVEGYFEFCRRFGFRDYPRDEEGIFRIVGGEGTRYHNKIKNNIVQGTFLDAVKYAVQQMGFYSNAAQSLSDSYNGRVIKIAPIPLELESEPDFERVFRVNV